jgi:HK97 family phage prohead protease
MIIRNKSGDYSITTRLSLLDYLRGVTTSGGVVKEDVALFVPIALSVTKDAQNETVAYPWTFSTFDLDRYDERVDPGGWDVEQYKRNPVVQWAHRYDIPAIGVASGIATDDKGLHGNIVFNGRDFDPFGWSIGERVKAGVLRAGSVGFRVMEIELPDKEGQADGTALIFRKQELLEFSICNVPANPFALTSENLTTNGTNGTNNGKGIEKHSDFFGGFLSFGIR